MKTKSKPPQVSNDKLVLSRRAVEKTAKVRPAGYLEEILATPGLEQSEDGQWLIISRSAYAAHCAKWSPPGLGDKIAAIAQPIARAIDRVAGTDLEHCQGCHGPGGRQERLNVAFPVASAKETSAEPSAPPSPPPGEPAAIAAPPATKP